MFSAPLVSNGKLEKSLPTICTSARRGNLAAPKGAVQYVGRGAERRSSPSRLDAGKEVHA